jgi:hypothetical protein
MTSISQTKCNDCLEWVEYETVHECKGETK